MRKRPRARTAYSCNVSVMHTDLIGYRLMNLYPLVPAAYIKQRDYVT